MASLCDVLSAAFGELEFAEVMDKLNSESEILELLDMEVSNSLCTCFAKYIRILTMSPIFNPASRSSSSLVFCRISKLSICVPQ